MSVNFVNNTSFENVKKMIKLTHQYTFQDPYITAASGLQLINSQFYLVADDENSILRFPKNLDHPTTLIKVFSEVLPEKTEERKKTKPDFESLLFLPDLDSLLCIPSGSKKNRSRAAIINLQNYSIQELSFRKVYAGLERLYPELNIEGAVIIGDKIRLFQRGNGKLGQNAIIDLNLKAFLQDHAQNLTHKRIDLGKFDSTPFSFTDATLFKDFCWYLAVAENSESTFLDGDFLEAYLGKMDLAGNLLESYPLNIDSKPEGIAFDENDFYVVTDDDDRRKPSSLYRGRL